MKVSRGCNNNCIFCLDDRERRTDVTVEEVRMLLDGHRSLGEMLFTCGEPTIHPRLPEFVRMARDRGYRSIGLVTNGRRLSYRSYAACLLDEGIDEATISIHGSSARVHDALTRTRGSFEQTLAGLDNVLALRGRRGVRVVTSTVIARRNMARAEELIEMLGSRGVDTIVLNVVEPSGEALAHFDTLNPGYEEIAAHLEQAIVRSPHRGRVVVEGIPPCLCRAFLSCTGVRERIHLLEGGKVESLPPDRNHVKTARCEGCDLTAICPGVFVEYVRRRGWDREE